MKMTVLRILAATLIAGAGLTLLARPETGTSTTSTCENCPAKNRSCIKSQSAQTCNLPNERLKTRSIKND